MNRPYIFNYFIFIILYLLVPLSCTYAQDIKWETDLKMGINNDPKQKSVGEPPYEMKGRQEARLPILNFDDCTLWQVRTNNSEATLYRTQEQRVIADYSGKLVYTTKQAKAGVRVELVKPLKFDKDWDCINFWNYGNHWLWENSGPAMTHHAIIKDAKGKEIRIPFMQEWLWRNMNYKYWFLNHIKLNDSIQRPITLIGLEFTGEGTVPNQENKIFLGPLYGYKENLQPIKLKELPVEMPFPLRKETILPTNKSKVFKNSIRRDKENYLFTYEGDGTSLTYRLQANKPIPDVYVNYQGVERHLNKDADIIFADNEQVKWRLLEEFVKENKLVRRYHVKGKKFAHEFVSTYQIVQKSLIWTIEEKSDKGQVSEIRVGKTGDIQNGKLVDIPFLSYNPFANDSYTADRPSVLYADNLFYMTMFDWYFSNGSVLFAGEKGIKDKYATYNGGVKYGQLNNKTRNPVRERLFYNVSPDVQEVFPTIDNPASPMRSNQVDRLWAINGGSDLAKHSDFVTGLRSKGVEKVSIRYHEETWRADGESFTFRTQPNPNLSVQQIKNFVKFVQNNDWRIGLYTNYMDLAPVNAMWNEDWVRISNKDGGWGPAWCRNYAPKVEVAYEQQAKLAPQIHKMFNTNFSYCDVATCVSPMDRVDYDYRSSGAGKFRTVIEYLGMTLLNERRAYQGPVYSEGGSHFFYAGLADGNYSFVDKNLPIFPDFQLLKINPLEMDAMANVSGYEYLAYAYAFGNIGILSEGADAIMRYAFLQPFQSSYAMVKVKDISYIKNGDPYNSSDAVKMDLIKAPQLKVTYENNLELYANFSDEELKVLINGQDYYLPKFGVMAYMPDRNLFSFSGINSKSKDRKRLDLVYSDELYYLDTHAEYIDEKLGGKGCYMLKKEKFGWEIIPVHDLEKVQFDLNIIDFAKMGVDIEAVDKNGDVIEVINEKPIHGKVSFDHQDRFYKYRICPVSTHVQ